MISFLISLAVLFGPAVAVFLLIANSGTPGGVGTEAIGGALLAIVVFFICAVVVGLNYAWLGWW